MTCSIIQEFIIILLFWNKSLWFLNLDIYWILINVQFQKTQQNVQNAFFKKSDFTFFKTDSITGVIIVLVKKLKKNIFIFWKNVIRIFGHLFFDTKKMCQKISKTHKITGFFYLQYCKLKYSTKTLKKCDLSDTKNVCQTFSKIVKKH